MLVIWSPRGPRIPMAWGGCVGAAGYPMGCQIGRRRGTKRHWRDLRRPLKFPNLIVSLTRFSHVLEGFPGPLGSIWRRPRRLVIEIRQIWGLVSPPVLVARCGVATSRVTNLINAVMIRGRELELEHPKNLENDGDKPAASDKTSSYECLFTGKSEFNLEFEFYPLCAGPRENCPS